MHFYNLRVSYKLWGVNLGLLIVLVVTNFFAQRHLHSLSNEALQTLQKNELAIQRATKWQGLTQTVIERTIASVNVDNPEATKLLGQRTAADSAAITELQKQVQEALATDAEKQAFETISETRKKALGLLKKVPEIKAAGDASATLRFTFQEFEPAANTLVGTLKDFVKVQEAQRNAALQATEKTFRTLFFIELAIGAAVMVLAVGLIMALARSITEPLQRTVNAAQAISGGDLAQNFDSKRMDEFGDLLKSFDNMSGRLRLLVGQVRSGVDSITSAAVQIAQGTNDLSARTENTAANLEETAASIEELTSTVTQSSETARQANELAVNAAQAAERGGAVVGQVVKSMEQITASSSRIADIIGVIDGISFQTNILALNAAVEAARAGEQGRGFAVVAGEVRTLAQRSAEAAKEIKELIAASVQSVESGSRQVNDAGSAMQDIVASVRRVSELIAEISATSSEQREGISQVNQAVSTLDQMTQQNAALVEESAAAASALQDQAQKLADVVAVFNVGAGNFQSIQQLRLASNS